MKIVRLPPTGGVKDVKFKPGNLIRLSRPFHELSLFLILSSDGYKYSYLVLNGLRYGLKCANYSYEIDYIDSMYEKVA